MLKLLFLLPFILPVSGRAFTNDVKRVLPISKDQIKSIPLQPSITIEGIQNPIVKSDTPTCTIPFTRVGKLILIKGKADTTEGNFIFDTGAPYLVLNSTYFRNMERLYNEGEVQRGITGEGDGAQKTLVNFFRLGTINYYRVESDLVNLGPIEKSRGVKILGLLGVSLFKECELVIDYLKNEIHLHHINKKDRKTYKHALLKDPTKYTEHSFTIKDNRIMIPARLGQKKLQFVVDYGAESNLIDSRLPGSVLDSVAINGRIFLTGAGSRKVEAVTGALSGFAIIGLQPKDLPVIVTSFENSCFANDACINGVLGYDFLSNYRMVFNFVTSKLYVLQ